MFFTTIAKECAGNDSFEKAKPEVVAQHPVHWPVPHDEMMKNLHLTDLKQLGTEFECMLRAYLSPSGVVDKTTIMYKMFLPGLEAATSALGKWTLQMSDKSVTMDGHTGKIDFVFKTEEGLLVVVDLKVQQTSNPHLEWVYQTRLYSKALRELFKLDAMPKTYILQVTVNDPWAKLIKVDATNLMVPQMYITYFNGKDSVMVSDSPAPAVDLEILTNGMLKLTIGNKTTIVLTSEHQLVSLSHHETTEALPVFVEQPAVAAHATKVEWSNATEDESFPRTAHFKDVVEHARVAYNKYSGVRVFRAFVKTNPDTAVAKSKALVDWVDNTTVPDKLDTILHGLNAKHNGMFAMVDLVELKKNVGLSVQN